MHIKMNAAPLAADRHERAQYYSFGAYCALLHKRRALPRHVFSGSRSPPHQSVDPATHNAKDPSRTSGSRVPNNPLAPLVRQAIEAAFGHRDPDSLTAALFDMGVRSHLRARQRTPRPAGKVRVLSCHVRENGEFFGTVAVGPKRCAWVARISEGRLVSFKVL